MTKELLAELEKESEQNRMHRKTEAKRVLDNLFNDSFAKQLNADMLEFYCFTKNPKDGDGVLFLNSVTGQTEEERKAQGKVYFYGDQYFLQNIFEGLLHKMPPTELFEREVLRFAARVLIARFFGSRRTGMLFQEILEAGNTQKQWIQEYTGEENEEYAKLQGVGVFDQALYNILGVLHAGGIIESMESGKTRTMNEDGTIHFFDAEEIKIQSSQLVVEIMKMNGLLTHGELIDETREISDEEKNQLKQIASRYLDNNIEDEIIGKLK